MDRVIVPTNMLIWPKIKNMVPDHKLIFCGLWQNTQVSSSGAYFIDLDIYAAFLGFSRSVLEKAINDYVELNLVVFDESTSEIFIIDWWRFHKCDSRPQIGAVQRSVNKLKSDIILNAFFKVLIPVSNKIKDLRHNITITKSNITEPNITLTQPKTTTFSEADVVGDGNGGGFSESSDLASRALTALREQGKILDINNLNPDFIELITLGLTVQDFLDAVNSINDSSKRKFNYVLKVAKTRYEAKAKLSSKKNDGDWTPEINIGPDGKIS